MDPAFWTKRWQDNDIGFHQPDGHDLLRRLWPTLDVPQGAAAFVPLSGKSLDMRWLAERGHRVVGAELSEIAVDQFFASAGLTPAESRDGPFLVKSAGPYVLYCGDMFDLAPRHLPGVTAAYDRAALIALPTTMRPRYAECLAKLSAAGTVVLLISVEYPEGEIDGPPFSVSEEEIRRLFAESFEIGILETRDGLAGSANLKSRGVTRLVETAYALRRRV